MGNKNHWNKIQSVLKQSFRSMLYYRNMTAVLSKEDIRRLIQGKPPLLEDYVDLEAQLQPNGFDLSLREVAEIKTRGRIAISSAQREISSLAPLSFDGQGFVNLVAGSYVVTYNEIVNMPADLMALARPRSSLLRCGVAIATAVWDAGYSGRSQSLMVVHNPEGFTIQKNARITQLVFFLLTGETEGYRGIYQRENTGEASI